MSNNNNSQDLLFRHFEKAIFGVLVLLAVFLVYSGIQMPDFLKEAQPDRLEQGANQVRASIDEDHWSQINEAEPRTPKFDVVARTNQSIRPVSPQLYRLSHPWEGKSIDISTKREDPELFAPFDLRVSGVLASLAIKSADEEYPLMALENADPIEKKEPEPPKQERGRRRGMGMGSEEMMMGSGEMGMGYEETMMGSEEMMMGSGGAGMGGGMGTGRKIDAKKYDQGFRPSGATKNLEPVMGHFIAGVALMPHKEIFKAYKQALQQADGFDARRDIPTYLGLQLYRADVTDKSVDELVEADWILRGSSKFYQRLLLERWAGMAKEIVAGKYRDPELTTAIPPVLLKHYASFASHPKIPLGDEDPRAKQRLGTQPSVPTGPILPDADGETFENLGRAGRRGGMGGGMMAGGYGMEGGMMDGGYGMESGMMGGGMMGGSMMGGGMLGGGMMRMASVADQPDHKLIRFYDFRDFSGADASAPQPGRRYVYRLRVGLEDPNFPQFEASQPRSSTLSAEVFRRVENEQGRAKRDKRRNFVRWTEFSDPSDPISLPSTAMAFAGPVVPAATRKGKVEGRDVEYVHKPATGRMVVAEWDLNDLQVPLPVLMDVSRGTILAKKADIEIPDPLSHVVKKLPDAEVNTEAVVLDISGGNSLAISEDESQTVPSMMLLFDVEGGLRVVDEVTSQQGYRMYSFADERGE